MRSSGGRRLNNPKKIICCNVKFLDDAVATYEIPKDAKGSVLFQSVIRSLELNTNVYFGLLFTDPENFAIWLDLEKKIKSQVKSEAPYKFEFRVKYYVSEPGAMLVEELTRYQYVLQLKQDLFHQRLSCTFRTLALLASFIVQSELGDFDLTIHKPGYLKEFKFVPNQPTDLEAEIAELHKMHVGLSPEEVELRYLEKAKWLTAYGVDMRDVRDHHGVDLKLGIAPAGIQVYQAENVLSTFEWPRITKLRFHQKKFYIKVQPKEPGSKEQEHYFLARKTKHCKLLWKICLEHHGFYKSLPPIDRTATLLRSTSQKSHSNGTQSRANIRSQGSFNNRDRDREASYSTTPRTPHRTPRTPQTPTARTPTSRTPVHNPTTPTRTRRAVPTTPKAVHTYQQLPYADPYNDQQVRYNNSRPADAYYNSLPKKKHYPDYAAQPRDMSRDMTSLTRDMPRAPADTNRYIDYNNNYNDKQQFNNHHSYNSLTKRSKSIGAGDALDLDYPQKRAYSGTYKHGNYDDDFKSFFTDTVLQHKMQYGNHGKSWANNVNTRGSYYPGNTQHSAKSTPDVRLATSQPAFITSAAMRQANFLMTTEL